MTIKKAYREIIDLLESNADAQVADILERAVELASAKTTNGGGRTSSNVRYNDNGSIAAIFCYYHKKWEDPAVAEFGKKAGTATGLNNMCKVGVSNWSKQNAAAKKANQELLGLVAAGEVHVDDIPAKQAEIEAARTTIIPRADGHGEDE